MLGLVLGGLIKTLLPLELLQRHLSQNNLSSVTKATLLGAPLPLCSCGVVPAAVGLRQAGASKPATVSFLISTPETGVDSISLTYALLGPVMAVARLVSALFSAFFTGLLVLLFGKQSSQAAQETSNNQELTKSDDSSCCETEEIESSCCGESSCNDNQVKQDKPSLRSKISDGLKYAFIDMFGDILGWLVIGLIFAALVQTYVPSEFLAQWGSGFLAMLIMLLIGIPMYVCATASTPIAVGLILAGISPGVALVFLLSGPATNIGTLGIIANLLGRKIMWFYIIGTASSAVLAGFIFDWLLAENGWSIVPAMTHDHETLPEWLQGLTLAVLVFFAALIVLQKIKNRAK